MKNECCNINNIVQEYYSFLRAYILKRVNNTSIADDLVQEVMMKLIETHQKSTTLNNTKAWLFQVCRNVIYDYFKNNNVYFNEDIELHNIENEFSDIEKIMVSDFIIPMIDLLPKEYAVPLKLCDIERISQKEIAAKLNIGLSATKMRIQRGRQKLRELFVECCDMEYDKNGIFVNCTIKNTCTPLVNIENKLKENLH